MTNEARNTSGKFAPKSGTPRKIRAVNLTDETWNRLAAVAEKTGKSRNDFLESLLQGNNPFIETVLPQTLPLMDTVAPDVKTDAANMAHRPGNEVLSLMKTMRAEIGSLGDELETVRVENQQLYRTHLRSRKLAS
ncbi:hypothetical protein [Microcoleus sp. AT9b-C3]|uniref:hypothetical protein n=1 Tax=Microcoleus sp. AT9b-C3 TaxID=2818629 RepID=UPI002FD33F69